LGFSGIETQSALFAHLRSKADKFKAKWCWCIPIYNNELSWSAILFVMLSLHTCAIGRCIDGYMANERRQHPIQL